MKGKHAGCLDRALSDGGEEDMRIIGIIGLMAAIGVGLTLGMTSLAAGTSEDIDWWEARGVGA